MPAQGDAYVVAPTSIANNAFLDLDPGSGNEVVLSNIYYANSVELYWYDGTNGIMFYPDPTGGGLLNTSIHMTHAVRVRIKNVSGSAMLVGADGMYTKP